jgi:hypothetical protein
MVKSRRILSLNDRDIQTLSLYQAANQNLENKKGEKMMHHNVPTNIFKQNHIQELN